MQDTGLCRPLAGMGGVAVEKTRKWAGLDERLPIEMKENSSPVWTQQLTRGREILWLIVITSG